VQAVTLAEVADELYGLPPGEFIAARDERARQAKAAGRREDAAAIRKLARPTTSAWLVNQLSRGAPDQLGRLFELGAALQEAQRTLAGDRLRELSGQRRQVVGELLPVATGIAGEAGQVASAAVLEEVRATLEAALADQDVRDAVRSGRLTKALAYAGLGEVDLTAAFAQVPPASRAGASAGRGSGPAAASATKGEPSRAGGTNRVGQAGGANRVGQAGGANRADDAAEALAEAEAAAATAADAVASAERDLAAMAEQRQFQRRRIAHLERELAEAQREDSRLASDEREARRRRDQAQRQLAAAERQLDRARRPPGRARKQPG
jgi:DNA repair exonuclease SbcCD ATPase subunit